MTVHSFAVQYDFKGFSNIMYMLKTDKQKKVHPETIKKFEDAFNISIDDSGEVITYSKNESAAEEIEIQNNTFKFPIISTVYAGFSDMILEANIEGYAEAPYKKQDRCFMLRVKGDSMNGTVNQGDLVLVDIDAPIYNNCLIVVRTKEGKQLIKRYKELNSEMILLYSDNSNFEPLTLHKKEIEAFYRVVGIWKAV